MLAFLEPCTIFLIGIILHFPLSHKFEIYQQNLEIFVQLNFHKKKFHVEKFLYDDSVYEIFYNEIF